MSQATLMVSAAFALVAAAVYGYVGRRLGERQVSDDASLASHAFAMWWYGLAATSLIQFATTASIALGFRNVDVLVATSFLSILAICVALWGLLYYLIFVFTGKRGAWLPLALGYAVYYVVLIYWLLSLNPMGVDIQRWTAEIAYEQDPNDSPMTMLIIVLLLLPQIGGALAYFSLYFRLTDRSQRYRVAVVSWSIIVWFGSSFLASLSGLGEQDWWQVFSRLIGLAASLAILAAYQPPKWVQRRLHVDALSND